MITVIFKKTQLGPMPELMQYETWQRSFEDRNDLLNYMNDPSFKSMNQRNSYVTGKVSLENGEVFDLYDYARSGRDRKITRIDIDAAKKCLDVLSHGRASLSGEELLAAHVLLSFIYRVEENIN